MEEMKLKNAQKQQAPPEKKQAPPLPTAPHPKKKIR